MKLPNNLWKAVVSNAPIFAIDLLCVSQNENDQPSILLGLRNNNPAKNSFFVPGGRIFKNETRSEAFHRITSSELSTPLNLFDSSFYGIYEHFYSNSFFSDHITSHYIVETRLIYNISCINIKTDCQHSEFTWISRDQYLSNDIPANIHKYTHDYLSSFFHRGRSSD